MLPHPIHITLAICLLIEPYLITAINDTIISRPRREIVTRHGWKISYDLDTTVDTSWGVKDDRHSDPPPRNQIAVPRRPTNPELIPHEYLDLTAAALTSLNFFPAACSKKEEICYEPFGCFYTYKGPMRHLCRLPRPPTGIATEFRLFLKDNITKDYDIHYNDKESWKLIPRNSRVVFMTHGNYEQADYPIYHLIKNELLAYTEYNVVILVDFHRSSGMTAVFDALQVYSNLELMGREVTYLARQLMLHRGVSPQNMYYICFSIGCIAPRMSSIWARERYGFKFGRMSIIESSQILTERYPEMLVGPDDADFVDAYHSSGGADAHFSILSNTLGRLGIHTPIGHVDFYVNNGRIQPHCFLLPYTWCSHIVARRMFLYSIRTCYGKYKSYSCKQFNPFTTTEKACIGKQFNPDQQAMYGFYSNRFPGRGIQQTLTDNFFEPYC